MSRALIEPVTSVTTPLPAASRASAPGVYVCTAVPMIVAFEANRADENPVAIEVGMEAPRLASAPKEKRAGMKPTSFLITDDREVALILND